MLSPGGLTVLATAAMLSVSAVPDALKPETLAGFDRYVRLTEQRIQGEVAGNSPLLWIDRQPAGTRPGLMARLGRGEIVSERLETKDRGKDIDAGGGLIHHWVGTVLLPGIRVDRARAIVQDYERYSDWFGPLIRRAHVTSHDGDHFIVAMRTEMHKILTVTVDADYDIQYRQLDAKSFHVRSIATGIQIVDSAGTSAERRTPAEQTFGFLWRLNTYCSFKEVPEGTFEQCESVSLTRDVPFGMGPIIRPLISGIPRETMEFTLGQVRKLVTSTNH